MIAVLATQGAFAGGCKFSGPRAAEAGHARPRGLSQDNGEATMYRKDLGNTGYFPGGLDAGGGEEVVFFYAGDGCLYALDGGGGFEKWRAQLEYPESRPYSHVLGRSYFRSPVIVDGRVYMGTSPPHASVVALDAQTGERVWELTGLPQPVESSVAISDGVLFCGASGSYENFFAVSIQTGERLWEVDVHGESLGTSAVDEGRVFAGSSSPALYALDAATGAIIWKFQTGSEKSGSPKVVGDTVIVNSEDGFLYAVNKRSGELVWKFRTAFVGRLPGVGRSVEGCIRGTPAYSDGVLVTAGIDTTLVGLSVGDGEVLWQVEFEEKPSGIPVVHDGCVYVGVGNEMRALRLENGEVLWTFSVGEVEWLPSATTRGALWRPPAAAYGRLYLSCEDGNVYALDGNTGKEIWRFRGGGIPVTPCVVAD